MLTNFLLTLPHSSLPFSFYYLTHKQKVQIQTKIQVLNFEGVGNHSRIWIQTWHLSNTNELLGLSLQNVLLTYVTVNVSGYIHFIFSCPLIYKKGNNILTKISNCFGVTTIHRLLTPHCILLRSVLGRILKQSVTGSPKDNMTSNSR